jgi:hypothetical protein
MEPCPTSPTETSTPVEVFIHIACTAVPPRARNPRPYTIVERITIPLPTLSELPPVALIVPEDTFQSRKMQTFYFYQGFLYKKCEDYQAKKAQETLEKIQKEHTESAELPRHESPPPENVFIRGADHHRLERMRHKVRQIRELLWIPSTNTVLEKASEPTLKIQRNFHRDYAAIEYFQREGDSNTFRIDQLADIEEDIGKKEIDKSLRKIQVLIPEALRFPRNPGEPKLAKGSDTPQNIFKAVKETISFRLQEHLPSILLTPPPEDFLAPCVPFIVSANADELRVWITPAQSSPSKAQTFHEILVAREPHSHLKWWKTLHRELEEICKQVIPPPTQEEWEKEVKARGKDAEGQDLIEAQEVQKIEDIVDKMLGNMPPSPIVSHQPKVHEDSDTESEFG